MVSENSLAKLRVKNGSIKFFSEFSLKEPEMFTAMRSYARGEAVRPPFISRGLRTVIPFVGFYAGSTLGACTASVDGFS